MSSSDSTRVGLVSDTHGLFDPRLRELLAGCDLILHAGDVVKPEVLHELARIAPLRAVRGNNDDSPAFTSLPELAVVGLGALTAVVVHEVGAPTRLLPAVRHALAYHHAQVLVYGHSHRPFATLDRGVLLVNPGSAGPQRFRLPRTAGLLQVQGSAAEVRLFDISSPGMPLLWPPVTASW